MEVIVLLLGVMVTLAAGFWVMEKFAGFIIENKSLDQETTVAGRKKEPLKSRLRRWWSDRKTGKPL